MSAIVRAINNLLPSLWTASFLALLLFSCKPEDYSNLFGTYLADYDIAKERLTLNKDGTFVQEVTIKATSKIDKVNGKWTYDSKTGYLTFHDNFMLVLNGLRKFQPDYAQPKPGLVGYPVNVSFGKIRIGSNEGIIYKKID
jgi:hypothetical protein